MLESRLKALMVPTVAVDVPVGSGFGFRPDPFSGRAALHTGLDFPAEVGVPVHAAAGGVVVLSDFHPEYGNLVEIDHGNGLVTRYAHNSKVLVKAGTWSGADRSSPRWELRDVRPGRICISKCCSTGRRRIRRNSSKVPARSWPKPGRRRRRADRTLVGDRE